MTEHLACSPEGRTWLPHFRLTPAGTARPTSATSRARSSTSVIPGASSAKVMISRSALRAAVSSTVAARRSRNGRGFTTVTAQSVWQAEHDHVGTLGEVPVITLTPVVLLAPVNHGQ